MSYLDDDDRYDRPATLAEADREYAYNVGAERRDVAWVLSDRDVWYPNPYYRGPPEPHPEDAVWDIDDPELGGGA